MQEQKGGQICLAGTMMLRQARFSRSACLTGNGGIVVDVAIPPCKRMRHSQRELGMCKQGQHRELADM